MTSVIKVVTSLNGGHPVTAAALLSYERLAEILLPLLKVSLIEMASFPNTIFHIVKAAVQEEISHNCFMRIDSVIAIIV